MGLETTCSAQINGHAAEGKLQLEVGELRFGPAPRLKILAAEITGMEAKGGRLLVRWPGGEACFELGKQAANWLQKIRSPRSRLDKLGVKEGVSVVVVGVVDEDFLSELESRVPKFSRRAVKDADIVFLGVSAAADLARVGKLRTSIKPDGALWTIYPKGQKQLTQAMVMEAGKAAGLVDTKVVGFSETHSGLKWVVPVGARAKRR